ncbi:MAG: AarF/ABC1/UbiB kinase family protein [Phycisphaerae bacterium]|nr:AarF/ABC1/UbiB kinase family protein [Phycisphaerae bacterium]
MASVRNMMRYAEILGILAKYGFGEILRDLKVQTGMAGTGVRVLSMVRRNPVQKLPAAVRFRMALEELGPTFIKLGQVLSTRPDLVPQEYCEELKRLQSECPRLEFETVMYRLKGEFKGRVDEVFQSIDPEPLGSASMAQTHRAVLKDGQRVVIKVLRPGIHIMTEQDMEILRALAEAAEERLPDLAISPVEVLAEFARELRRETDLTLEGRSCDRFRKAFRDDPDVAFPKVYWEATTRNCLALEEFQGILLSRLKPGDLTEAQQRAIVERGAKAVLRQCLEIGFFHADPHPGNLFALPGDRVGFIDCGMTGRIDDRTTALLADLVFGVVKADVDAVIEVVGGFADVEPAKLQDRLFRSDVRDFLSNFHDTPLERLDMGKVLKEFFDRLRAHHIRCPSDMVLLIKALTTIEGVAKRLAPDFDMVGFARPSLEKLVKRKYSVGSVRKRLVGAARHLAAMAEHLPGEIQAIISQFRKNRVAINLEHRGLDRLNETIEHASRNIAFALIIAAIAVGSAILVLADRTRETGLTTIGTVGFTIAGLLTVLLVLTNWGWTKSKRRPERERDR